MKMLFVDETDRQESARTRTFFCLCGLVLNEEHIIAASNELESIKIKYGLDNLKDSRKTGLSEKTRLDLTQEVFDVLAKHEAQVIGIVLGETSMSYKLPKEEMYMGAISFLMERFTIPLIKEGQIGSVVCDSLDSRTQRAIREKFHEFVRKENVQMAWDAKPMGAYHDHVLPTLLFTDDEQSVLVQAVDLVATSLNSAIVNTTKGGKPIVVNDLPNGNKFLSIYWPLFVRSRAGKVEGWGIKNWD